jgi:4-hydroxy-3-polyprenylbenzoate decarboxylase
MTARVVLGVSGASGAALALDCARALRAAGAAVDLVLSAMAERTLALEIGPQARDELVALADRLHPVIDLGAAIAFGLVPRSRHDRRALFDAQPGRHRAGAGRQPSDPRGLRPAQGTPPADPLAREAPLTLAHLRNMTAATEMGAIVMPPVPAFYLRPETTAEITAQIAARAVDLLRIASPRARAWAPPGRRHPMTDLSLQTPVGDIASDLPGAAELFRRNGIGFCCGGTLTLAEAAAQQGCRPRRCWTTCAPWPPPPAATAPDETLPLIDHILARYHETHRTEMDWLIPLADRVETVHGDHDEAPLGLTAALIALRDELDSHMAKEEQVLFPMMRQGGHPMIVHPIGVDAARTRNRRRPVARDRA